MLSHQCERFSQGSSTHTESKAFFILRVTSDEAALQGVWLF